MLVQDLKLLEAFEGLARVDQIKATLDGVGEHFGVDPDDLTRYAGATISTRSLPTGLKTCAKLFPAMAIIVSSTAMSSPPLCPC